MLNPAGQVTLAAGGGMLHEPSGVNVMLARVVMSQNTPGWRLQGNLLFQKPFSSERDSVDLITSVGWARKLAHGVSLGVEAIGEDLEGFWDSEEAEGGARLLAGPSLHISPAGRRWQLTATGGPMFHPSDTNRSSGAFRDLPPETNVRATHSRLQYQFRRRSLRSNRSSGALRDVRGAPELLNSFGFRRGNPLSPSTSDRPS